MGLVSLTFTKQRTKIDAVVVDATISELFSAEVEVTEHPVEKGAAIVDHLRPKPETIQIEGVISNTPIPQPSDALQQKTSGTVVYSSRGQLDASRASTALQDLLDIKDKGILVDVVTALRRYENMALKSLSSPRDRRTGEAIRFTAVLVAVKVVSNKEETVDDKGKSKSDLGKKATTTAPEAETNRSTLKSLSNTDGGNALLTKLGAR